MDNKSISEHGKEFVTMDSSSSPPPRNDNNANSPNNSNTEIDEHDEEFAVMASSSLPLSVIDDGPNNLNYSSINMAQHSDEYASAVSSPSLRERTSGIDIDQNTNESASVVSPSLIEFFEDLNFYFELYQAVRNGDWERASIFLKRDPNSISVPIGTNGALVLHLAVELGVSNTSFLQKLVEFMPSEALALGDSDGATALFNAARAGNIKAAKLLVNKNPSLPNICENVLNFSPLHAAVRYGHKEMTLYLLRVTEANIDPNPFTHFPGSELLYRALMVGFNDVALYLVKRYPDLATCNLYSTCYEYPQDYDDLASPLTVLATRPSAFRSGSRFNLWQLIIYHCVPVKLNHFFSQANRGGMENQIGSYELSRQMCYWNRCLRACQKANAIFWELVGWLVPPIKRIQETKTAHSQALQLLKHLCITVKDLEASQAKEIFSQSFINAAKCGIPEILEETIKLHPLTLEYLNEDVFRIAVLNRDEKVVNLICKTGMHMQLLIRRFRDESTQNNILHLVGTLPPPHRLRLVSGAALQMQRELHWFKEFEKYAPIAFRESKNHDKDTPKMIFIKEHEELIKEGEKWIKGTAKSYTLAAALIATVVFAAAISIPGGNHDNTGIPNFSKENTFKLFAVSDALSLFLSIASVLIFLSILTARYAESDFLHSLPRRLIFGLATLFFSVTFMMIAYSIAIYLVFGEKKAWILITLGALACLPVTLYGIFQFPLLVVLIRSTYLRPRHFW